MSKLIVPSYLKGNEKKVKEEKKEEGPALDKVPQATGWRMVVLPFKGVEKTKGGLLLTDKAIEEQQLTTKCVYLQPKLNNFLIGSFGKVYWLFA